MESVLKRPARKRGHVASLRFTTEEFDQVKAACVLSGIRGVSGFLRAAVFEAIGAQSTGDRLALSVRIQLATLGKKLNELEAGIGRLDQALNALTYHVSRPESTSVASPGTGVRPELIPSAVSRRAENTELE